MMRSYGLGTAFTMLIAALYAFQNRGNIIVKFLIWERNLPQGVWEIALFALGCIVMWFISLSAILEKRHKNTGVIKEQKLRIAELEKNMANLKEERDSLMLALRKTGDDGERRFDDISPAGENSVNREIADSCLDDTSEADPKTSVSGKDLSYGDLDDETSADSVSETPSDMDDDKGKFTN